MFTALPKHHAQFIYKFLAGASEFGRTMGGNNFRDFLPINVPKRYRGEIYVLRWETLQNNRGLLSWTRAVFLHNWHCVSYEYSHTRKKQPQRHLHHNPSQQGNAKSKGVYGEWRLESSNFNSDLGHIFGGDVRKDSGILMRGKELH